MTNPRNIKYLTFVIGFLLASGAATATDGVVLIDQARALAGGITPGDTAGFPVTISVSGSYRLSGNLTVPDANTNGIVVTAGNVSIDLNGFSILGPTVCGGSPFSCTPAGTGTGIDGGMDAGDLSVRNGKIRGMGQHGLRLGANGMYVENLQVSSNGGTGMYLLNGTVTRCTVTRNGDIGIFVNYEALVSGNHVVANRIGIEVGYGLVSGNTVQNNRSWGAAVIGDGGYAGNTFVDNNGGGAQVSGGINLGQNLCGAAACAP